MIGSKPAGSRDIQTYVFVWGLNDKDQLGGPKGSKIKMPMLNDALSSLNCVLIAGGSKSLFCGESCVGHTAAVPLSSFVFINTCIAILIFPSS